MLVTVGLLEALSLYYLVSWLRIFFIYCRKNIECRGYREHKIIDRPVAQAKQHALLHSRLGTLSIPQPCLQTLNSLETKSQISVEQDARQVPILRWETRSSDYLESRCIYFFFL